jgi:hypothetical protein
MIELSLTLPPPFTNHLFGLSSKANLQALDAKTRRLVGQESSIFKIRMLQSQTYAALETRLFALVGEGGIALTSPENGTTLRCDELCESATRRVAREISHSIVSL